MGRTLPATLASILTLGWFGAVGYAAYEGLLPVDPAALSLIETGAIVGGVLAPIMVVWLVALVFQRTDPLLEHRLDMAQNLNRAFAPVDAAEARVHLLNSRLKKSVEQLEVAGNLAAERLGNLEDSFKAEISDLFSATADTEAKATAMRDALRRERDALLGLCDRLDGQIDATERRFSGLQEALSGGADMVEERTGRAVGALEASTQAFQKTGGETADRLTALQERLDQARRDADTASQAMEDRLGKAAETLTGTVQKAAASLDDQVAATQRSLATHLGETVRALSGQISQTSDEMAHRLDGLSESLTAKLTAAEQGLSGSVGDVEHRVAAVEAMAERLNSDLAETGRHLADTTERTVQAARELDDGFGDKVSALARGADQALAQAQAAATEINRQAETMRRVIDDTLQSATDGTSRLSERIHAEMASVPETVDEAVEVALTPIRTGHRALAQEMDMLSDHARTIEKAMEDRLASLNEAAHDHTQAMTRHNERLNQEWNNLINKAEHANVRITEAADGMESRAERIQTIHDALLAALDSAEKRVEAQGRQISTLSQETVEAFREMIGRADTAVDKLGSAERTVLSGLSSLGEAGEQMSDKLQTHRARIDEEHQALNQSLETSQRQLIDITYQLANERDQVDERTQRLIAESNAAVEKLQASLNAMGEAGDVTEQTILHAAERFQTEAQEIRDIAEVVDKGAAEAGKRLEERLSRTVARSVEASGGAMDQLASLYRSRFSKLTEETARGFEQALAHLKQTTNATTEARDSLVSTIRDEANRLEDMSRQFEDKAQTLAERRQEATEDEFVRASSFIIERLASDSIDVTKVLMDDVPDDAWSKFLAGDRSRFARQALKIGTPQLRQRIRDRYESDGEFRTAASKYIREFEGLLGQTAQREGANALSTTLVSSDLGKLYTALVQALRKTH